MGTGRRMARRRMHVSDVLKRTTQSVTSSRFGRHSATNRMHAINTSINSVNRSHSHRGMLHASCPRGAAYVSLSSPPFASAGAAVAFTRRPASSFSRTPWSSILFIEKLKVTMLKAKMLSLSRPALSQPVLATAVCAAAVRRPHRRHDAPSSSSTLAHDHGPLTMDTLALALVVLGDQAEDCSVWSLSRAAPSRTDELVAHTPAMRAASHRQTMRGVVGSFSDKRARRGRTPRNTWRGCYSVKSHV